MVLVCVNGSVITADAMGLIPALTVIAGYTTAAKKKTSADTMARLHGLRSRDVVFIEKGDDRRSAEAALHEAKFQYEDIHTISHHHRLAVIQGLTGLDFTDAKRDDRPSNGLFAAILALWAGAETVTLAGFSLQGGHSYLTYPTPRDHQAGDVRCLQYLTSWMSDRIRTTCVELHSAFRITLGE